MTALLRKLKLLRSYRSRDLWRLLYGSKWVAAGALLFDEQGRVLLMHHRWRRAWEYPMGMTDGLESPLETARREVGEEVGLHPDEYTLVGVDFFHRRTPNGNLTFTFAATVTPEQATRLKLDPLEAMASRWVTREEALELIAPRLQRRLREMLRAYDEGAPVYLESGDPAE
jgi:8-oxo-dGTP diphosphatase